MTDRKDTGFYIGYHPKAPGSYRKTLVVSVMVITAAVLVTACILAISQHPFSRNVFEFGTLTTIEGTLTMDPVPRLLTGPADQPTSVLLVGFGKCGAEATLEAIENQEHAVLDGREIALRGTLIYGEGKTLMELTEGTGSWGGIIGEGRHALTFESVGNRTISGKIIDPKCYFGVMKPGEGKTHRSCAIRCISGGIPPVFKTADGQFILLQHETISLSSALLAYVDDLITINGALGQSGDWLVMEVDPGSILPGIVAQ